MGRFQADDFGYSFANPNTSEERERLVVNDTEATAASGGDSLAGPSTKPAAATSKQQPQQGYELYQETPPAPFSYRPPKQYRGGESYISTVDDNENSVAAFVGMACCCLTICLVLAGGILVAYEETKDSNNILLFVGSILLVMSASSCLCGCCMMCTDKVGLGGAASMKSSDEKEVKVRFRRLNDRYEKGCNHAESSFQSVRLDVVGHMKQIKKAAQQEAKERKDLETKRGKELEVLVKQDLEAGASVKSIRQKYRPVVFVIVFDGDMMASKMELLRKQVSLIVQLGTAHQDQCVVILTSPGGSVSHYGLASSQLVRIRKAGIRLVACVDTVAASGGYMMASVANVVIAAPFAMIGSVGVVTQIPNFQRFLNHHKIDAYLMTAGEHKRTIDVIGEVTEDGKSKMKEQLDDIHVAFKEHIAFARPKLAETIEEIANGEHWLAVQAKEKGLVDEIMTSDEYLESVSETFDIIEILEKKRRPSPLQDLQVATHMLQAAAKRLYGAVEASEKSPMPMAVV